MKKLIFTILIMGIVFQLNCFSPEKMNCLPSGDSVETRMYIKIFNTNNPSQPIDFNNVSGYVGCVLKNIPSDINQVYIYVDDEKIGSWKRGWDDEQKQISFRSDRFQNGWREMRWASINLAGDKIIYEPIEIYFNNLLYNVHFDSHFHPTQYYHYSGFYDGEKSLEVKLVDLDGKILWPSKMPKIYSGNYIRIVIPGSAFGTEQLCDLNINDGTRSITEHLFKKFKKEDWGPKE
jgi:hypothetical protein